MNRIGTQTYSLEQLADTYFNPKQSSVEEDKASAVGSFQEVLQAKQEAYNKQQGIGAVLFSKHANERLNSRNIHLTEKQMERLSNGIEQARDKNINESLVMLDNLAFIVNIRNNTVITALDQSGTGNHVFTNIDGAVII